MKSSQNANQDNSKASLQAALKRHLSSIAVLAYRYHRHLPHLTSPGLSRLREAFLTFSRGLRRDIGALTTRIIELGGTPIKRVEDIERGSYLPLLLGARFDINDLLHTGLKGEERLQKMLSHTRRLARKIGDDRTVFMIDKLLASSTEREFRLQDYWLKAS